MKVKEYSKKISIGVLYIICYAYFMGAMGSAVYFNWKYAKDNGFIKWLFLGEIIPTAKSVIWPYYVFFSTPVNRYDSPDANHFRNSKKAFDEALMVVDKIGDVTKLPSDLKIKFADLLRLAIAEANQVQPLYLQKAHPDYPSMYEKKHKNGMSILLQGIETDNTALILEGAYKVNEFSDWIQEHKNESSP